MPTDLHLALQAHYAGPDGLIEAPLGAYKLDVLRDGVAYEIQTASFGSLRAKLHNITSACPVVVVFPVAQQKTIVRVDALTGLEVSARRSPKHGQALDLCSHLPFLVSLVRETGLLIEVVLTEERELRCDDGKGSWRRRGVSLIGRELVAVLETHRFDRPADYLALLPPGLPRQFTVADLASAARITRRLAGKVAYCLRELGALRQVAKQGNAYVYTKAARLRKARGGSAAR